jgi:hypothetical protein
MKKRMQEAAQRKEKKLSLQLQLQQDPEPSQPMVHAQVPNNTARVRTERQQRHSRYKIKKSQEKLKVQHNKYGTGRYVPQPPRYRDRCKGCKYIRARQAEVYASLILQLPKNSSENSQAHA